MNHDTSTQVHAPELGTYVWVELTGGQLTGAARRQQLRQLLFAGAGLDVVALRCWSWHRPCSPTWWPRTRATGSSPSASTRSASSPPSP